MTFKLDSYPMSATRVETHHSGFSEHVTTETLIGVAQRLKTVLDDFVLKQPQMPVELTNDFIVRIIEGTIKSIRESNPQHLGIRVDVDFTDEMNKWMDVTRTNMFRNRSHLLMCGNPEQVEYLLSLNAVFDFLRNYFETEDISIYSKHVSRKAGVVLPREQGISIRVHPDKVASGMDRYIHCLKTDRADEILQQKLEKAFVTIEEIQRHLSNLDNKLGETLGVVLGHLDDIKTSVVKRTSTTARKPNPKPNP